MKKELNNSIHIIAEIYTTIIRKGAFGKSNLMECAECGAAWKRGEKQNHKKWCPLYTRAEIPEKEKEDL